MIFGHFSDLHGNLSDLFSNTTIPDMWVSTGDFFPNSTRGKVEIEKIYQAEWLEENILALIKALGGAPIVSVEGNHDYISLAGALKAKGYPAFEVTPKGVMVKAFIFAGFREIPYIFGEWAGETHSFQEIVEETLASNPDFIVTHAPPAGLLDKYPSLETGYGISELTTKLTWSDHNVKAHFFGHAHAGYGRKNEMGIEFINGSEHVTFHKVE